MISLFKNKNHSANSHWAEGAVMYQIYPRSFQDSNGDGVGDLPGITQRLDYLKELGINGIWLSPFYPSPMADFGYDISDYRDVDPIFGNLEDFKKLLSEAHARDIKIIVDVVPNHSSDDHMWFQTSKQSQTNPCSDWYVWRDPKGYKDGTPIPPNNWLDIFSSTSAWEWAPERKQFYLHSFDVRQPDLNWRNPEVREAMKDVLRYWLDLGVDGFRVDAVPFMAKDPDFRDDPPNPHYNPKEGWAWNSLKHLNSYDWPEKYEYLHEMSEVLKEQAFSVRPRFMVTEGYVQRFDTNVVGEYLNYSRAMDPLVATPFIFEGIERPLSARDWRAFLRDFHSEMANYSRHAVAAYAFGNHDKSRLVTRFGKDKARAVAVLMLTLPGMIFVYNGEEIGMHDVSIPPKMVHDPSADGGQGRDPERTPMQWSAEPAAGFSSTEKTWLPLAHDYHIHNVETQKTSPDSFLNLYSALIQLRNSSPALKRGPIKVLKHNNEHLNEHLLVFKRQHGGESYSTVINLSEEAIEYTFDKSGHIILSSITVQPTVTGNVKSHKLSPFEAIVIRHG